MRTNWGLTAAVGGLAMIGGFIAGCQTYDFEQVEPLSIAVERKEVKISGRTVPPNLMILLDKSDSMDRPENPDLPACQTGDVNFPICGTGGAQRCDENTCPTRLSRLREAINDFLAPSADGSFPFRVGLAAYPIDGQCSPTPRLFVELPNSEDGLVLGTNATNVNTRIQNLFADDSTNGNFGDTETAGGTPTAESLRYLRNNVPGLKDTAG